MDSPPRKIIDFRGVPKRPTDVKGVRCYIDVAIIGSTGGKTALKLGHHLTPLNDASPAMITHLLVPAAPRRRGQPYLDSDRGVRHRIHRRGHPTKSWQILKSRGASGRLIGAGRDGLRSGDRRVR
jgi:hypothetical protein